MPGLWTVAQRVAANAAIALGANQPPGYVDVTSLSFGSKAAIVAWANGGTYGGNSALGNYGSNFAGSPYYEDATDATAPHSPSGVGRFYFPNGHNSTSHAPARFERRFSADYSHLYVGFWAKLDADWYGHSTSENKMLFVDTNESGSTSECFWTYRANGNVDGQWTFCAQSGGQTNGQRYLTRNNATPDPRGVWTLLETVLACNTNGLSNGSVRLFVNGVEEGYETNWRFRVGATSRWLGLKVDPVWGGSGAVLSKTGGQRVAFDDLRATGIVGAAL